jgi:hypothetical protein
MERWRPAGPWSGLHFGAEKNPPWIGWGRGPVERRALRDYHTANPREPVERSATVNIKRFVAASLAVFVVAMAVEFLVHGVILMATYESLSHLWRPGAKSMWWMIVPVLLVVSPLFTYIFVKGYENKGILEGVRFGVIIGLFTCFPTACGMYMAIAIPYSLALQWFVYGMIQVIVLGIVAALIYRPAASA